MKVLITGSRHHKDKALIQKAIIDSGATILIHGYAHGADAITDEVGKHFGLTIRRYPALWGRDGMSAGRIRNQHMLSVEHTQEEPIDLVLAFPLPGSKGTIDMIQRATYAGIPVEIVEAHAQQAE